jgi:hypothetical protein
LLLESENWKSGREKKKVPSSFCTPSDLSQFGKPKKKKNPKKNPKRRRKT